MSSASEGEKELVLLKTRPGVLAKFFRKSRDQWKDRCQQLRSVAKGLRVRIRDLESSRSAWRVQAEQHAAELRQLRQELSRLQDGLASSHPVPEQKPSPAGRRSPPRRSPGRPCRVTSFRRGKSTSS